MSATSQVAAQLAQVARQLQGSGVGGDGGGGDDRPLDGGLPDNGVLVALADVATNRLYAVFEAEDGTLYLELSSALTSEEFMKSSVRDEAKLVFRRTVRPPAKRSLARDHRPKNFRTGRDATAAPRDARASLRRVRARGNRLSMRRGEHRSVPSARHPDPRATLRASVRKHTARYLGMSNAPRARQARRLGSTSDPQFRSRHTPQGEFFGFEHPPTGRYLQYRQRGARKLVFYSPSLGVNEQFEAPDVRDPDHRARFRANERLTTCAISPRRFPSVRFHVKMYNIAAATREPTPWQRNLASGGMTMAGAWRTPTLLPEAPLEALPEPPTSLGSSRANSRPPTAPHSRAGSRGGSLMVTPTVSPTTFERRKSWRAALSLDESAFAAPDTAPAPVRARRGLGVGFRPGAGAFSAASTPGWMLTPGPGGGTPASSLAEASQEDALDLGMRLMSKFARNSEGRRRLLRQVFAAWKHRHETIKRNTMYAMNIANLMRRALQRRNFHRWMTHSRARREEERVVTRHRRIAGRNKRMRLFRGWCEANREGHGVRIKVRRGVHRVARRLLASAFFDWADLLAAQRDRENAATAAAREAEECEDRAERLAAAHRTRAGRFERARAERRARRYFAAWRDDAAQSARLRRAATRCATRLVRRTLARAFAGWSETATSIHRERVLVRRATAKLTRRAAASAFYEWLDATRETRAWERRVRRAARCVAAVARRRLFLAFAAWRENTARTRRARRLVDRAIRRALRRRASRAFHRWATTTAAQRDADGRAASALRRRDDRIARTCARFALAARRRLARGAFTAWSEWSASRARNGRKLRACVARFRDARTARAFDAWFDESARIRRFRRLLARVIAKMTRRRVAEAFFEWRDGAERERENALREAKLWRERVARSERFLLALIRRKPRRMSARKNRSTTRTRVEVSDE